MSNAQFSFQDDSPVGGTRKHRRQGGGGASVGGTDTTDNSSVAGSLTYSATSSVQSGGSAAGESTDSSFADILRAIDSNDAEATELVNLTAKVGVGSAAAAAAQGINANGPPTQIEARRHGRNGGHHRAPGPPHLRGTSSSSVASSLQYSEDGESYATGPGQVHPAALAQQQRQHYQQEPQTVTGQPSDSSAPDLGGLGGGGDIHFAPAHEQRAQQQRSGSGRSVGSASSPRGGHGHGNHRQQQQPRGQSYTGQSTRPQHQRAKSDSSVASMGSGRSRNSRGSSQHQHQQQQQQHGKSKSQPPTHNRRGSGGNEGTPPTSPPPRARRKDEIQEAGSGQAWYSQWWMCGFSDALTKFGIDPE